LIFDLGVGEIARLLGRSPSRIKEAVDSLENEGVIVGASEGTAKRLRLNPRYVAAQELKSLITKLGSNDLGLQELLSTLRRPLRKAGKEI
jgi:biotin operon repressor